MKQLLKKPCRKNLLNANMKFDKINKQKENYSSKKKHKINNSRTKKSNRLTTQKYSWLANSILKKKPKIRVSMKSE